MSVKVTTNGGGSLRWPTGQNFKAPLTGRAGFWMGFWFENPAAFAASGGSNFLIGGTPLNTGTVNGINGLAVTVGGNTSATAFLLSTTASGANATTARMWEAAGASTAPWAGMTPTAYSSIYLFVMGVVDTGGGVFKVFRAIIPKNGAAGAAQVEVRTPAATWAGLTQEFVNQIFIDNLGSASSSTYTAAETMVEHVAIVEGAFPNSGGSPDTAVLAGLANGSYQWDSPAVLNGGSITSWRPLLSVASTTGSGTASTVATPLTVRGTVVTGTALAPWSTMSIAEKPDGFVYEGVSAASSIKLTGTKQAGQSIEFQIGKTDASVHQAWGATGVTYPTSTTWQIIVSLPVNSDARDYRLSIRDAANTADVVVAANAFGVGAVLVLNDQSTFDIDLNYGKPPNLGALTAITTNNVRVARASSIDVAPGGATFQVARCTVPASSGSGIMALADQIGRDLGAAHVPIMLVNVSASGQPLIDWTSDAYRSADSAKWRLWSGFMAFMAANCDYRATALIRQIAIPQASLATGLGTIAGMFDTLWANNIGTAPVWLLPPARGNNTPAATVDTREAMRALAATGGRWKFTGYINDNQLDGDSSHHQATGGPSGDLTAAAHAAGNIRRGLKQGRMYASLLQPLLGLTPTLDRFGPVIVSAAFTSGAKTAIDVTFDRDIHTPSGATTGLPQHWVSTDAWATKTEFTGGIIAPRVVRITKPSGDWTGATLRYDYCRDVPFSTSLTSGVEVGIRTSLDTLIYDTTAFEGGRGIMASPILGAGLLVSDFTTATLPPGAPLATFNGLTAGSLRSVLGAAVTANKITVDNVDPLLVTGIVVGSAGLSSADIGSLAFTVRETKAGAPNSPLDTNLTLAITA